MIYTILGLSGEAEVAKIDKAKSNGSI